LRGTIRSIDEYYGKISCTVTAVTEPQGELPDITVNESDNGDFEAVVVTDYSTYVLRIPAGTPSRGQVLFGDSYDQLQLMANVGCYE